MNNSGSFWLPPAKSTLASDTDALFYFITDVSTVLFFGIVAVVIFFVIRYRRRSESDITPDMHHNNVLEITWSFIPLVLVLFVFSWGFTGFMDHRGAPDNSYEIQVVAKKWSWEFRYANGVSSLGELHVPADRPIKLVMRSDDVIHSFFVPDFRVKHDVIPGRYTSVWFEVPEEEEHASADGVRHQIYCTEYCGTSHSDMLADVVVHDQSGFDKWLESGLGAPEGMPLAEYGKQLFQSANCWTCHTQDGGKGAGPSMKGLFGRMEKLTDGTTLKVDESYIRESILEPNAKIVDGFMGIMPSYKGTLKDFQVDALIEFIKGVQ